MGAGVFTEGDRVGVLKVGLGLFDSVDFCVSAVGVVVVCLFARSVVGLLCRLVVSFYYSSRDGSGTSDT